jgi:Tfp pilus assembly major pilin PilA
MKSQQNGISLIALIITIIVIIILAAIVIGVALNTPENANRAKFASDMSEVQHAVKVKLAENYNQFVTNPNSVDLNSGFTRVSVNGAPDNFDSFAIEGSETGTIGYLVNLNTIKMENLTMGQGYKTAIEVTFGATDAFVYDAEGEVFYAFGYQYDGTTYYSIADLKTIDTSLAKISISINPNGAIGGQINTQVNVEDDKEQVNPDSLQYGWSTSQETQPTEWTSFTSGQSITKDITDSEDIYYLWVKATDMKGNEQTKISNSFYADNTVPTITLSATGDIVGATSVEITAEVTYGFSGVENVKWLVGTKVEGDFASAGTILTEPYKFTVEESGTFTVYIEGKNGKKAISTITVTNIISTGFKGGTPNAPVLEQGMIPVKWGGSSWVVTNQSDPDWYNYIDNATENGYASNTSEGQACRKWANVMLSDGTYKASTVAVGQTVTDAQLRKHVCMVTKI